MTASTAARPRRQPRVERGLEHGDVDHTPAMALRGEIELLEMNEMFEIGMQECQRLKDQRLGDQIFFTTRSVLFH